jgi:hypothetical protein
VNLSRRRLPLPFVATPAVAQDTASAASVGVTGGTLGIGPEIGWRTENLGVRGSATFFSLSRGVDFRRY